MTRIFGQAKACPTFSVDRRRSLSGNAAHCYDIEILLMALRFYNTLTQTTEPFAPFHGNVVRMYTCGPTVYNYVHIGNLRTFTFQDILRRWLRARGYSSTTS